MSFFLQNLIKGQATAHNTHCVIAHYRNASMISLLVSHVLQLCWPSARLMGASTHVCFLVINGLCLDTCTGIMSDD